MKHCVEARLQVQALFDDGNKDVDGDGDPSVKPRKYAGQEEYHEIQHEGPGGRNVSQSKG